MKRTRKGRGSLPKSTLLKGVIMLFVFTSIFKVQANTLSQNPGVTLSYDQVKVGVLMNKIEQQTGMSFLYNVEDIDLQKEVSVHVQNMPLAEVLTTILEGFNLTFSIEKDHIVVIPSSKKTRNKKIMAIKSTKNKVKQLDKKRVIGKVTDENGVPLPDVGVMIEGTNKGVSTNFDGEYKIEVEAGNVLVFTYVGFLSQKIRVTKNTDQVNVSLIMDVSTMDEVVVVGYSKKRREDFTGAVTSVGPEVLKTTQNISFADALIGVVPGMLVQESFSTPDTPPTILLRGIGSINSSTEPLIVVDGVQMPSGLDQSMLNASDIEDISILKDAAATSIYGSKGSNGVMLITTKRGGKNQELRVEINSRLSLSYPEKSFTKDLMNATQVLDYGESIGLYEGRMDVLEERRASGNNVKWADLLLKNGSNLSHDATISGGSEKINYYSSISHSSEDNLYGSRYNRTLATVKLDFQVFDKFKVGFSGSYGQRFIDDRRVSDDPFSNSFLLNPWEQVYEEDGKYTRLLKEGQNTPPYNPLYLSQNMDRSSTRRNFLGGLYAIYSPASWLTLKGTWGGNFNTSKNEDFEKIVLGGGSLRVANSSSNNYTANFTAEFDHSFGQHHFNLLLGTEVGEAKSSSFSSRAKGFLNDKVRIISAATNPPEISESKTQSSSLSYFSRMDYDYNKFYNFSASLRRDGSSRFGQNNKYANFWSLGAGWNIYNDLFRDYENGKLNSLRLRASIGTSGNDFIGNFDHLSLYGFNNKYDGVNVATLIGGANPSLTWEKNKNINIGVDFGLFENRISGSVDYYVRDTKDLINNKQISYTSGFSNVTSNIGQFRNQGIEFSLNTINIKTDDFSWSSTFNFSNNRGRIIDLNEDEDLIQRGNVAYEKGAVINALYIIDWLGVNPENGLNQYEGLDGEIIEYDTQGVTPNQSELSSARRVTDKTSTPKYFGGFMNYFNYKNFDLSFAFVFSGGNYLINSGVHNLYNKSYLNQHVNLLNAWKKPGDQTDIAVRSSNLNRESDYSSSTQFLQKGDYIKLKNLTLGYNFDRSIVEKMGLGTIRIYAQGQNLLTFSKIDYTDPEYSTLTGGIGLSSSIVRKFSLGINVTF